MQRLICLKELAYMFAGTGKFKICRSSVQAKNSAELMLRVLSSKSRQQSTKLETQASFLCYNLEGEFLLQEASIIALKDLN